MVDLDDLDHDVTDPRPPFGVRLHEAIVRDYYEDGGALRLSVRVESRRAARLAWEPRGAFAEREVQVVYAPAGARYF